MQTLQALPMQHMSIKAGDWGKKYLPYGRSINMEKVTEYLADYEQIVQTSRFVFMKAGKDMYYCLDCQHRVVMLDKVATDEDMEFLVNSIVLDSKNFKSTEEVADFVTDINNQYRQTVCTKLEVYKHEFPFLIESEKFGRLTYETKGKTKALYTNVIPAYLAGKSYLAGNPKICNFKNADDIIAATKILTVSDAEIIDKFLAFWIPLNSVYRSMNFKTGSLLSKPCLAAGFIIWGQNQQLISPTYLQQKIADSESSVSTIRNASHSFSVGNVEELIDTFLFIFNKSRRSNFLKVNGKTGR